jgi:hydrogenase/urease accessory protein HupE
MRLRFGLELEKADVWTIIALISAVIGITHGYAQPTELTQQAVAVDA